MRKKSLEIAKYDWKPEHTVEHKIIPYGRFKTLLYLNRRFDAKVDPGVHYSKSVFQTLYKRGQLTGVALQDAKRMFED